MSQLSLQLLVDVSGKRVLFAEAGKEAVDLLFQMLSLPVAYLTDFEGMSGSLPNLYRSLERLDSAYVLPNLKKETYLKPTPAISGSCMKLLPAAAAAEPSEKSVYVCGVCCLYAAGDSCVKCPECDRGLVKDLVTYMVYDDLTVVPPSPMSEINKLAEFNIKDLTTVEQKTITLGTTEVLKLFKASVHSKTVLTDSFL